MVIIGAGFGGLGAARALRQQGIDDITILERADAGRRRLARQHLPGRRLRRAVAALLVVLVAQPARGATATPAQAEILDYLERAAGDAGLLDLVRTGQQVSEATYDDRTSAWRVTTTDGTAYDADVVVSAVGQLSDPVVPDLPGRGLVRRAGVPLGAVAPRRAARGHPGRGGRDRRQRDPVRAGDRRPRSGR